MLRKLFILVGIGIVLSQYAYSQYEMRLDNDSLVSSTVYEFDVYIRNTSGSINLTSYQIILTYNTAIANGGTLTFSYLAGSSASSLIPSLGVAIRNDGGTSNLTAASNAGSDAIDVGGKRLGRFRLSNSVTFDVDTSDVSWDFDGTYKTIVNIDNVDNTNPSNHVNLLRDPVLPGTVNFIYRCGKREKG